ncbi:MAG: class I SAM-dependent methyltransferase [Blastocatellia bacterium]|nr:class I SAM-dependent methyltransferase [Blastocatellia bacterium]
MSFDTKKLWDACGEAFDRFTTAEDSFSENIERPALELLVGEIAGARVLDLGCGSGAHSLWLAERGAEVTGLDLSHVMIAIAREKARERGVALELGVADLRRPLPFGGAVFDMVFTSTALHYVENIGSLMRETARVMKPDARLIASVLHPMSTACFPAAGSEREAVPDLCEARYFGAPVRSIRTPWLDFGNVSGEGRRIFSYHHTASDYFHAIRSAGLTITDLCEPEPPASFATKNPSRHEEAMRVPVYMIFRAGR